MIPAMILLVSLLGAHITYFLSHRTRLGAIRASAISTLVFVAATTLLPFAMIPRLQAAFFGATFVGMSDRSRLCERRILFAAAVYALVFISLSYFRSGVGGTLGASAFVSCLLVYLLSVKPRARS